MVLLKWWRPHNVAQLGIELVSKIDGMDAPTPIPGSFVRGPFQVKIIDGSMHGELGLKTCNVGDSGSRACSLRGSWPTGVCRKRSRRGVASSSRRDLASKAGLLRGEGRKRISPALARPAIAFWRGPYRRSRSRAKSDRCC
jgi:hypothetical protein